MSTFVKDTTLSSTTDTSIEICFQHTWTRSVKERISSPFCCSLIARFWRSVNFEWCPTTGFLSTVWSSLNFQMVWWTQCREIVNLREIWCWDISLSSSRITDLFIPISTVFRHITFLTKFRQTYYSESKVHFEEHEKEKEQKCESIILAEQFFLPLSICVKEENKE